MSIRDDVREFLSSRRAHLRPEQAGLPLFGGNRRVPGLRREEVALLAGVSVDYYNRLERGNLAGVSDTVLDAIAGALQLDEAEREHLRDLARAANASPTASRAPRTPRGSVDRLRPSIQRLVDAVTEAPVVIRNQYFDYVAFNALGRALYAPVFADPRPNSARFTMLNPAARDFYQDWEQSARELVATMRGIAGRLPYDRRFSDLVGELSTRSDVFRSLWGSHDVRYHRSGVKRLHHPVIGDLELVYEALELPNDPGLSFNTYTAEPGSASADALKLLASWAASGAESGADTETRTDRNIEA